MTGVVRPETKHELHHPFDKYTSRPLADIYDFLAVLSAVINIPTALLRKYTYECHNRCYWVMIKTVSEDDVFSVCIKVAIAAEKRTLRLRYDYSITAQFTGILFVAFVLIRD